MTDWKSPHRSADAFAPSEASWRACDWIVAVVLVGSCVAMVFGWIA